MSVSDNMQHLTGAGLILLFILLAALGLHWLVDARRTRRAVRQWDRAQRATAPQPAFNDMQLPAYDGDTYAYEGSWPETGLARYLGMTGSQPVLPGYRSGRPVPAYVPPVPDLIPDSTVSGPFHTMTPTSDADEFIAKFTADTDAVIAYLSSPLQDGTEPGSVTLPG